MAVAYGLRLAGPLVDDGLRSLLPAGVAPWPQVEVRWEAAPATANEHLDDDGATLRCPFGGQLVADRRALTATFQRPSRPDHHVVAHPGLTGVGMVFARWLGRSAFHGGTILLDGEAWGLLAAKGGGKTTTLAALHLAGHKVLADDILVLDGSTAFTGPRTLDLRPSAADRLEGDFGVISVRGAERRRMVLGPTVTSAPFRGWIYLDLAAGVVTEAVPPAVRLARLAEHLAVRLAPRDPAAFLELVTLPAYRIGRPLSWEALPDVVAAIEAVTAGPVAV